jgi:hypothetical protein
MTHHEIARWQTCALAIAIAASAAACGRDTPTSPSNLSSVALAEGVYQLHVSLGALPAAGGTPSLCVAFGFGPGLTPAMASVFAVQVARDSQGWTVLALPSSAVETDLFHMRLAPAGAGTLTGTIRGRLRSADAIVLKIAGSLALSGSQLETNSVGGPLEGEVELEGPFSSASCSSANWRLVPTSP